METALTPRSAPAPVATPSAGVVGTWQRLHADWACATDESLNGLLASAADALDYAMLVVSGQGAVRLANRAAQREFSDQRRLLLQDGCLHACHEADNLALTAALRSAQDGRRSLLVLKASGLPLTLAVVPLAREDTSAGRRPVLLLSGRTRASGPLAVQLFAGAYGATGAETEVLQALCDGLNPQQIAARFGVSLCTVRTQILCLREKTGSPSINALLRKLAMLPPILPLLD
jgi:DNA-binding CsgD family transcriptional regulator